MFLFKIDFLVSNLRFILADACLSAVIKLLFYFNGMSWDNLSLRMVLYFFKGCPFSIRILRRLSDWRLKGLMRESLQMSAPSLIWSSIIFLKIMFM